MSRLLLILALGCTSSPAVSEPVVVAESGGGERSERLTTTPQSAANISFMLERASLADVARLLREVSGLRVVLDASVDPVAECVTITVVEPEPITVDEAIAITRGAFAPAGVQLERGADQLVFSLAEDAEPTTCLRTATRAATPGTTNAGTTPMGMRVARPTPTTPTPAVRAGIRTVSADEVLLTRAALDEVLANQAGLLAQVRVIPHEENGRVVALKMYGIRRSSFMGLLGFQNGDGLRSINGHDLTSPDRALEAYARLRSENELRVQLQRRGQTITRTIRIVDALP